MSAGAKGRLSLKDRSLSVSMTQGIHETGKELAMGAGIDVCRCGNMKGRAGVLPRSLCEELLSGQGAAGRAWMKTLCDLQTFRFVVATFLTVGVGVQWLAKLIRRTGEYLQSV